MTLHIQMVLFLLQRVSPYFQILSSSFHPKHLQMESHKYGNRRPSLSAFGGEKKNHIQNCKLLGMCTQYCADRSGWRAEVETTVEGKSSHISRSSSAEVARTSWLSRDPGLHRPWRNQQARRLACRNNISKCLAPDTPRIAGSHLYPIYMWPVPAPHGEICFSFILHCLCVYLCHVPKRVGSILLRWGNHNQSERKKKFSPHFHFKK